jgi:asparagine synthase (glutamine-hydrolysing)
MCGICGVYFSRSGRTADQPLIDKMCGRIVHRGPDDQGIYLHQGLALGMRRLSIIDLDTGSQPIFNEDRTVSVVFNGEIYNFQELRTRLLSQGHQFRTRSDTEVIVHLYEEEGLDFVRKLNGMFAIALWDERRRRLVLLRDRLGVKPLYYSWTRDGLVFGSELKCLLECEGVERRIDREALYHYFTLGYIPHPWSIFEHIRQLPPAGRLVVEGERMEVDRYWRLEPAIDRSRSREETRAELGALLADAVKLRMISDVPLGAFLSGGLDSSITVALMARQSSTPVRTFYIDFEEPGYSERAYATAVARRYGTEHHELVVKPSAASVLDELVKHFDEPFGDSSAIPTYYVSQITRGHVTVALAGDGGDESFGGYQRYREILGRHSLPGPLRAMAGGVGLAFHRFLPRKAPGRRYLPSLGMDNDQFYAVGTDELEARQFLSPDFLKAIPGVSTYELLRPCLEGADRTDPLSPYSRLDLHHYLPDDILTKVDRMSMAHSLEVRAPFLDYRVVELAASLPHDWKIRDGDTKVILKETFGPDLPPETLEQRKRGFSIPLCRWLREELRPMLEEAIEDPELDGSGILQMDQVRGFAREHLAGARDRSSQLWRFLFFARWWHLNRSCLSGA